MVSTMKNAGNGDTDDDDDAYDDIRKMFWCQGIKNGAFQHNTVPFVIVQGQS